MKRVVIYFLCLIPAFFLVSGIVFNKGMISPVAAWAQDTGAVANETVAASSDAPTDNKTVGSSDSVPSDSELADSEPADSEPLAEPAPEPGQTPVRIKADKMAYSDTGKTVSFFGNVKVTRDNVVLYTDKITAFFPESGKADKIDRILAEGNVKVLMDGRVGRCRKLTYFVEDGILRMEGSPTLTEGKNTVRGAVIKFYLKDSRSEILGGKNRQVEAVFVTPKDMGP